MENKSNNNDDEDKVVALESLIAVLAYCVAPPTKRTFHLNLVVVGPVRLMNPSAAGRA
jgi:hypothetical protein